MRWSLATIVLVPRGATVHADSSERKHVFEWAAGAGFDGVEISPHWLDIFGLSRVELQQIGDEVQKCGLQVSGVNINRCILVRHERARQHFEMLQLAVEAAESLSAPLLTLSLSWPMGGPARPLLRGCDFFESERREAAQQLLRLADDAAQRDIHLSLELHDDGMLDTAELCLEMLGRVGAPNVGVNPDLGNLVRSEPAADWQAALTSLAPSTNNWHVKNYRAGQPTPVWDGQIDYAAAFRILLSTGYNGWVGIESYFGDVLALQTQSLAYLKQLAADSTSSTQGPAA